MHKLLIALLIAFGAGDIVPPAHDTPNPDTPTPGTSTEVDVTQTAPVINNAGPGQLELVDEAIQRFAAHGMHLPPVEITFSTTSAACDGFRGLHRRGTTHNPVDQISICDEWPVYLYHELAHAWEHHAVADTTRAELLDRWQLSTWSDQSEDWEDRGIEQAAKTISYSLAYDHLPAGLNVRHYVCAFETLTGKPLPTQVLVDCNTDVTTTANADNNDNNGRTSTTPTATDASGFDPQIEKVAADDPRLAANTTVVSMSSDTETLVPWSWEHEGPGSNSLHTSWVNQADAGR